MITVIGSINLDYVVVADRIPRPGESVVGTDFFQGFGGKGANQAVGIARLTDQPVQFVGAVGDDEQGNLAVDSLKENGVAVTHVRIVPNVRTGVALITLDQQGQNAIAAAPGANEAVDPDYCRQLPDAVFRDSKLLVVCQEIPLESISVLADRAGANRTPILFDPAPPNSRLVPSGVLKKVQFVTPNETEAEAITGMTPGESLDQWLRVLTKMIPCTGGAIIMTLGDSGCLIFDPASMTESSDAVHLPAQQVTAVDTTAAGDAFNAGLAVGLVEGMDLFDACRFASQVASVSVTRKGAQPSLPARAEVT